MMKSASRRFLICFRPVELEPGEFDGGDGVFSYAQVKKNVEDEEEEIPDGPPKRSSRRFSKVLKSALFDNSLSRSFRSGSSRISVLAAKNALNQSETIVLESSPPSSGQNSSCATPTSQPPPPPPPPPPATTLVSSGETVTNLSCFNSGHCILVVSLALTVLWGRLFAIGFTLVWVYSFSRRNRRLRPPEKAAKRRAMVEEEEEEESWGYKKRVIMEGLLARNHHHRLH